MVSAKAVFFCMGLLVSPVLTASASDAGLCAGRIINAAGHIASGGMGINLAIRRCTPTGGEPHKCEPAMLTTDPKVHHITCCSQAVDSVISDLTRASQLLTGAAHSCGGPKDECGVAVVRITKHLSKLIEFIMSVNHIFGNVEDSSYRGENLAVSEDFEKMVTQLGKMQHDIELSIPACSASRASNTAAPIRHDEERTAACADASVSSLTGVVASGLQIDTAMKVCKREEARICGKAVTDVVQSMALASHHAQSAVGYCGGYNNLKCGKSISEAFFQLATAASESEQVQLDMRHPGWDGFTQTAIDDLNKIAPMAQLAAIYIGGATQVCEEKDGKASVGKQVGECVGDSVAAAVFTMTSAIEFSRSVKKCKHVHVVSPLACLNDIALDIDRFARVVNELLFASADCSGGGTFETVCGLDVTNALVAITKAVDAATQIAVFSSKMACHKHVWSDLITQTDRMGDALEAMAVTVEAAMKDCAKVSNQRKLEKTGTLQPQQQWSYRGELARKWYRGLETPGKNAEQGMSLSVATAGIAAVACIFLLLAISLGMKVFRRSMNKERRSNLEVLAAEEEPMDIVQEIVE